MLTIRYASNGKARMTGLTRSSGLGGGVGRRKKGKERDKKNKKRDEDNS